MKNLNIIVTAILFAITTTGAFAQTQPVQTQPKLTKVLITDKLGKNINPPIKDIGKFNSLPKKVQMSDSFQGRVIIFNNGCTRTCNGKSGTNETGEWSYSSSTGRFSCDGTAGPLECGIKVVNQSETIPKTEK